MKKLRTLAVGSVLAALFALSTPQAQASPIQWTIKSGGNGHFYELITTTNTFADAQTTAAKMGGYLVTVTSAEENNFILDTFGTKDSAWLGAFQSAKYFGYGEPAGGWAWLTGEKWDYTNWPDIDCCKELEASFAELVDIRRNENHLIMNLNPDSAGIWSDVNGGKLDNQFFSIVEWDPSPTPTVPEPSTLLLLGTGLTGLVANRRRRNPKS